MTTNSASPLPSGASASSPTRRASLFVVGLSLFLAGCAVSAFFAFIVYPRQGVVASQLDVDGYGGLARFIARGEGFSLSNGATFRRAPLYPYLVALFLRLFRHNATSDMPERLLYRPVLIAQCLLVGCNIVAAWTLARKIFNPRVGLIAALLCLVCPMVMRYVGSVEVETLMSLWITLMALTGYNLYQRSTIGNSILFALCCALATLTKAVTLLYPLLFLVIMAAVNSNIAARKPQAPPVSNSLVPPSLKVSVRIMAALVLLVYGLCLLPWMLRNYHVSSGRFVNISSNGPAEFLRGYLNAQPKLYLLRQDFGGTDSTRLSWEQEASNYEAALIRPYGLDFAIMERSGPRDPHIPAITFVEYELRKEAVESKEMKDRLLHAPGGFLRKFVIQLATFWYIVETRRKSLIVGAIALITLSLALYGWQKARAAYPGVFVIVYTVGYFNVVYAVFLAFARYSMPLYPVLLILTAFGISQLWDAWTHRGKT